MINLCFSQLYPPILEQVSQRLVPKVNQLVYCNWQDKERAIINFEDRNVSKLGTNNDKTSYLEPEQWWSDYLVPGKIQEMSLGSESAYIYPFGAIPFYQYWLLLLNRTLTQEERSHLQKQGEQLHQYLELYRKNQQQAAKIKLLEHVIQRTQHQLRHPLSLIKLYASNLQQELPHTSHQAQANTIYSVADELSEHLSDLLAYGEGDFLSLNSHNLRDILIKSIESLQPLLQEYGVMVDYPDRDAIAYIDAWKIKQVFDNLLSNAIYFSPEGSHIIWDWQVFQNEILVSITDQGPGLSDLDLCHLFQPFYSNRQSGQGLGLAIARKIILDHKGHLWAANCRAGGARFSFSIPTA
ncbi:MAG: HAMP domain-containing sensor histidine kinase [Cyanobacteria bacterium P01_F01_bin.150]